jgi:hypothetical protein
MSLIGWTNSIDIAIDSNNPVGLTNYQIKFSVQGNNPLAAEYIDWTKVNPDGSDFRFTDTDGTTLIDFWMYEFDNVAKTASFVFEVPSLLASTSKTIFMYYGNSGATSASSYSNTMSRKVVESTDLCILHLNEGTGTLLTDQTAHANNFTLTSSAAWNGAPIGVNPLDTLGVDNKFATDNAIKLDGTSVYALNTTGLLNAENENTEISCIVNFNTTFAAGSSNAFLFDKQTVNTKALALAATYHAENIGGTLLDTFPNYFYIEFGVNFNVLSGIQNIFQKVNSEGATRDSITLYVTGSTLVLEVYKNGVLAIDASMGTIPSTGTKYWIRVVLGEFGWAFYLNGVLTGSGISLTDDSLPNPGTARDVIWGTTNYGGTYGTNNLNALLISPKIYDCENESIVAYWPLIEASGTTLSDQSGHANTLTLSSASAWDATKTIYEGYQAIFVGASGVIYFQIYKCGVIFLVQTLKNSWAAGVDFRLRFCCGYEGMFIYVNEDIATLGGNNLDYRWSPGGGTDDGIGGDPFSIGCKYQNATASAFLNAKIAYFSVSSIHYSKRKSLANYEYRKITQDPFVLYGPVMTNNNISTAWGGGKKDFGEHSVIDLGGGTWQYIGAAVGRDTSLGYRRKYIHLATSTDSGRTWTDYASNPILTDYGRPHLLLDETGKPYKVGGLYYLYAIDNVTSGTAANVYLFTASDFTSTITNHGIVFSIVPPINISSISGDGATTTVNTSTPHGYVVGQKVGISGTSTSLNYLTGSLYNNILSVPTSTSFTFANSYSGSVGAGGQVSTFDSASIGNVRPFYDTDSGQFICLCEASGVANSTWWVGRLTSPDGITWTRDNIHNPVMVGPVDNGAIGSVNVVKRNGIYYGIGHGVLQASPLPTGIVYYTSTDTVTWTYNAQRTPFIQRAQWINNDQIGDPFIIDNPASNEVLIIQDQIALQGMDIQSLYIASGYTMTQALNPEPTIGIVSILTRYPREPILLIY